MIQATNSIDLNHLKRLTKPGAPSVPYPPTSIFSSSYTGQRFEVDLITANDENAKPLSVTLSIPFCHEQCYFCNSQTVITSDRGLINRYVKLLKREIVRTVFYLNKNRRVAQMHWGGGTPSYLTPLEIDDLGTFIAQRLTFREDAEISASIDPRGLSFEHVQAFRNNGVSRIRISIQDFDERIQRAVHRIQPETLTRTTIKWARMLGMRGVDVDLVFGLPLQTPVTFGKTLAAVIDMSPDRIMISEFSHTPALRGHQKHIHSEDLPSTDSKLAMEKASIEGFLDAGYVSIGMGLFTKTDDEIAIAQREKRLRSTVLGYTAHTSEDVLGFGVSAVSQFDNVLARNAETLEEYAAAVEQGEFPIADGYRMNLDDEIRKEVITELTCNLEVSKKGIEDRYGIIFAEYFRSSLKSMEEFVSLGFVEDTGDAIAVRGEGRFFLKSLAMCFDAYRAARPKDAKLSPGVGA